MLSGEIKGYREITVWKRSMELAAEAHLLIKRLPKEVKTVLADQIQRAALLIPANIAEGNGQNSNNEYVRYLYKARGSQYELETLLLLCVQLGYLTDVDISRASVMCDEIGKTLNDLISKPKA